MPEADHLPLPDDIDLVVANALREDVGSGDVTASLIPETRVSSARVVCREAAVLAGAPWFERVFRQLDARVTVTWTVAEGAAVAPDTVVCRLHGPARALVTGERSALNFLQTLSGTATVTRRYVEALGATRTRILDTRKTLPGLRAAQKYAVRAGGGYNHRVGLFDGILIKENHIMAAGGIRPALEAAFALVQHQAPRDTMIEIEVETLEQLQEALQCGARLVLLDNMSPAQMREAVRIAGGWPGVELEASGGINLRSVREIAETGVHRISIGSLTKDIEALDLSMRFTMH